MNTDSIGVNGGQEEEGEHWESLCNFAMKKSCLNEEGWFKNKSMFRCADLMHYCNLTIPTIVQQWMWTKPKGVESNWNTLIAMRFSKQWDN